MRTRAPSLEDVFLGPQRGMDELRRAKRKSRDRVTRERTSSLEEVLLDPHRGADELRRASSAARKPSYDNADDSMWNTGSVLSMGDTVELERDALDFSFCQEDGWAMHRSDSGGSPVVQYMRPRRNVSSCESVCRDDSCERVDMHSSGSLSCSGQMHSSENIANWNGDSDEIVWRKGGLLGMGTFAQVYLALNLRTGSLMAVKQVPIAEDQEVGKEVSSLSHEVNLLRDLEHPNIVAVLGIERTPRMLNLFLEYVSGGSIHHLIKKFGPLPEPVVENYARQILSGLVYLHGRDIVHRDLKGGNCLIQPNGTLKLADFGTAKHIMASTGVDAVGSLKGTVFWMAPELIRQQAVTTRSDIWSFGCTVIEMLTGYPPFSHMEQMPALYHIATIKSAPPYPQGVSQGCRSFLDCCFQLDPEKRSTAAELLAHPYLAGPLARMETPRRGRGDVTPRSRSLSTSM